MIRSRTAILALALAIAPAAAALFGSGAKDEPKATAVFPVPREQSVVVETDVKYDYPGTANPLKTYGTQWGSGWDQVANEWDWYINYATGERILWRTTGWEYSPDYLQLTWHVRKGVTWNDGVPYTAQDIVFTYQLWMKDTTLGGADSAANVASVSAPDEYTAVFRFKQPDYRFHQKLRMWGGGTIVARHIYEKQDPKTFSNWPPVETGPYKLQGWYKDSQLFVWQADPNYWGARVMGKTPGPKYVIFRSAPPPDLDLEEFVKGNVDMPQPYVFTIDMVRAAQKQWTHTVYAPFNDGSSTGIGAFNTARAPGSDREFRWALQYLVDREKLRKMYNLADSTNVTMWPWGAWKSLQRWEAPAVRDTYGPMLRYDPAFAAKELDRLGYRKGANGLRTLPDGTPLSLVLLAGPAPDVTDLVAHAFGDELGRIGIDYVFGSHLADKEIAKGLWDVAFSTFNVEFAFADDPFQMFGTYHSRFNKPVGELQTEGNGARLSDPTLDAIIDKMGAMNPDDPQYVDIVTQAVDRWFHDLPGVPAVETTRMQTFSDLYWTGWPVPGNMYQAPYQWWPSMIFIMFELKPAK